MESASSKMMILYGGHGYFSLSSLEGLETERRAKFLTFSLTMEIPLSSEAFNSKTRDLDSSGPYNSLVKARMVEVLPVPGGP
ncbi:hypothetical protein WICPIJ_005940 [Wickerhamomyces pijperi]|uniref:Uncharacterized protein n=1 Tax=Wickerhamomyces pijperi TaxID=599730 RepID=A0A9P8TLG0_WICPI|nr:hypothetical protein WICPIJ_005940 [Wickerhamomyces pijperi]